MCMNESKPTAPIQQGVTIKTLRGKINLHIGSLAYLDLRRVVPLETISNVVASVQHIERFLLPVTGKGDIGG